jgi:CheY-like chemotaxis protein
VSHYHALLIDDNPQNLKVLAQLLMKQGVTSTEVSDSRKLPTLIPTLGQIDIAFVDLEMPGLDGYKVKDMLKLHLKRTPIIAYTVHVSEINVVKDLGFDGFLGKPLDNVRFPLHLARILNGEAVWERS